MKNFLKLFLLALVFSTYSVVKAADITVTTTADDDDTTTLSLRDAIAMASDGDVIYLEDGNYCLSKGTLEIANKSLTIIGSENTFIGGDDPDDTNGVMDECDVITNRLFSVLAIDSFSHELSFQNVTLFGGNSLSSGQAGGALGVGVDMGSSLSLELTNVTFQNNLGDTGGAFFFDVNNSSSFTVNADSVLFIGNFANFGGALAQSVANSSEVTLNLTDVDFLGNSSFSYGGASLVSVNTGSTETISANRVTVDSNQSDLTSGTAGGLVFFVGDDSSAVVHFDGSKITNNKAYSVGGMAFYVLGSNANLDLNMNDTILSNNETSQLVGGMYLKGNAVSTIKAFLLATSVENNLNEGSGGGGIIFDAGASSNLRIDSSSISENYGNRGGGLFLSSGVTIILNSTLSSNSAKEGGAIYTTSDAVADIYASTIVYNNALSRDSTASGLGGGIYAGPSIVTTFSTMIAFNTADDSTTSDCDGSFKSGGFTLTNSTRCTITPDSGGTDILDATTVSLKSLDYNGGPTRTHELNSGSTGIDTGKCTFGLETITTDQRGFARTEPCDIGAYEFEASEPSGSTTGSDTTGSDSSSSGDTGSSGSGDTSGSDTSGSDTSGSDTSGTSTSGTSDGAGTSGGTSSDDTSGSSTSGDTSGSSSTSGESSAGGSSSGTGSTTGGTTGGSSTGSGTSGGSTGSSTGGNTTGGITGANPDVDPLDGDNLSVRGGATSDCSLHVENTNQAGTFYFVLLALSFLPLFSSRFSKAALSSASVKY